MSDETPPRRTVSDRYHVVEKVGSGGFGTVWRATDERGGPDVAVKFPRADGEEANDAAETRARFRSEHEVLKRFAGGVLPTSVVRYVERGRGDPGCLVLEYVDGTELSERFATGGLEPGMAVMRTYGLPVVRAMEYLHRNGVCYLDCKPANVLVRDRTDTPVLVDFNTVEPADSASTLFYEDDFKAPEQTPTDDRATGPGTWSDVYAIAKLLWYLLTGETSATSETPTDGVATEAFREVPVAVRQLIRRATRADPDRRPVDAEAFMNAFAGACGRDPAVAAVSQRGSDTVCPVRPGDSVGRVTASDALPDVGVDDEERYVSPVHLRLDRDATSWLVTDESLNGTYVATDDRWQQLLSEAGYDRLAREDAESVPAERYGAARLRSRTVLALVDPSYLRLSVDPEADRS